jgi:hypothetical protein
MPFMTMARVSAPPRTCGAHQHGSKGGEREYGTYVYNHVPDDFVIGNEVRELLLRLEKAVEEVLLSVAEFGVLHALHEALDGEAGGDAEVVEFVEGARPFGVLAEPFVEGGDLADLVEEVSRVVGKGMQCKLGE